MEQLSSLGPKKKFSAEVLKHPEKPHEVAIVFNGQEIADISQVDFEDAIESKGKCILNVNCGAKQSELIIEEIANHKIIAHTGVENVKGKGEAVKGETTLIYEKVNLIVQEAADQLGMPIRFILTTYPKLDDGRPNPMRAWANSKRKGRAIFQWDSYRVDGNGHAYFNKTFVPKGAGLA